MNEMEQDSNPSVMYKTIAIDETFSPSDILDGIEAILEDLKSNSPEWEFLGLYIVHRENQLYCKLSITWKEEEKECPAS